jgi:hypothetical protein
LIDVSISKKQATGLKPFYSHIDKEVMTYTYNNPNLVFDFKSYSIYGHITDLITVLFEQSARPWDDTKYLKRMKRLMFFILLEFVIVIKDKKMLTRAFKLIKDISEQNQNTDLVKEMIRILTDDFGAKKFFVKLYDLMEETKTKGYGGKKQEYDDLFIEINNIIRLVPLDNLNNLEIGDVKEEGNITFLKYKQKNLFYKAPHTM